MSALFTPFTLKDVTLKNRLAVPPMCQYSAVDGVANDWHHVHYPSLARGGVGLVIVEATAVSPEGRITPGCLGLWNDEQAAELAKIAKSIKASGAVPGIQIAHAGRKASSNRPWEGSEHIAEGDPRGWEIIAPSAVAFGHRQTKVPKEMTKEDIQRVTADFVAAATRARECGFEWLELHFAHGYLGQSFFSTHSNKRTDEYGGDFAGRSRFLIETFEAVKAVWPTNLPLTVRFGVIEYDGKDEETLAESIQLARILHQKGMDMLNVSVGFSTPDAKVPWKPGFLASVSHRVREEGGMPVACSWGLASAHLAERCVSEDDMDIVMIGRAMLANPHYPYALAKELGLEQSGRVLPPQYAHWLRRYTLSCTKLGELE